MTFCAYNRILSKRHDLRDLRNIVIRVTNVTDCFREMNYFNEYIDFINAKEKDNKVMVRFKIESERDYNIYDTSYTIDKIGVVEILKKEEEIYLDFFF